MKRYILILIAVIMLVFTGCLGSSEEVLLYFEFDEDGFAIECREGYRAGG